MVEMYHAERALYPKVCLPYSWLQAYLWCLLTGCSLGRILPDFFEFNYCLTSCGIRKYLTKKHSPWKPLWTWSDILNIKFYPSIMLFEDNLESPLESSSIGPREWLKRLWALCSCKGPGLVSQHIHGTSQPSIIPVPGDLMSSSDFCRHQAHK